MSEDKQVAKPDALRDIYRDAVGEDRGPSAESSAAILAHAHQQAKVPGQKARESETPRAFTQPAANDRHWLRHALGGLAAVGLVGWLMLQHAAWWDGGSGTGAESAGDASSMGHPAVRRSDAPAAEPAASSAAEISAAPAEAAADAAAAPALPAPSANRSKLRSLPPAPPAQAELSESSASRTDEAVGSQERAQEPAAKSRQHPPMAPAPRSTDREHEKAQLPLCPPGTETKDVKRDTSGKAAVAEVDKPMVCRPRKPQQPQEQPTQGAPQKRVPDSD